MMKDIKDKPDFEAMATGRTREYHNDYYWNNVKRNFADGCDTIWNDYHLPALKRIEELEKQLKPDFKN